MESIAADRQRALALLAERAPSVASSLAAMPAAIRDSAPQVLGASEFVLDALARDSTLITALSDRAAQHFAGRACEPPSAAQPGEAEFMSALRRWRRAEFVRIA